MRLNKNFSAIVLLALPMVVSAQVTPTSGMTSPNSNNPLSGPAWTVDVATTGDVTATVGGFDFNGGPGYTNNLFYVSSPNVSLGTNYISGTYDLGVQTAGTELVFRLDSPAGYTFYSGSLSGLNTDGKVHANIYQSGSNAVVDFEDLSNLQGSDWNYGDAKIVVSNAEAVPEPAPFIVLGLGALGLVLRRRA